MKPLVSIITITLNRGSLIHHCIESVQKQTYQNYEHIIVDGNSQDNTEEVVKSYNDPHIKYIKLPQPGCVCQTRTAFEVSNGEYITFLDDDDEYLPHNLEKKIELFSTLSDDYGLIYGPMDYFDRKTEQYVKTHKAILEGGSEILPKAVSGPYICGTPSTMYRRKAYLDIGGSYIGGIGNEMSDWALATRTIARGWKVKKYDVSLVRIFVNHGSAQMTTYSAQGIKGAKNMILFANHFLNEYADIIKANPWVGEVHYLSLLRSYLILHDFSAASCAYKKLLRSHVSMRNIVYPFYVMIKGLIK